MFVEVVLSNLSHLLLLRLFAGDEAIVRPRMQCPRLLDKILSGILENTKRETRARPRARFRFSLSLSLSLILSFSRAFSLASRPNEQLKGSENLVAAQKSAIEI